jgi:chromosome segregation ATPase
MLGFSFLIAVIALVLAVAFWFQWQSAAGVVKALQAEVDSARKEAEAARAEARKASDEVKARTAQLNETREKLNEVRKKAQEARGGKTASRGAREAELEEDLAHARKLLEEAHAAEAAAHKDLQAAKAAEAQARAELAGAQSRIRELSERPAPAAPPADYDAQRKQLEAARSELERQVEAADRNQRESRRREQELREEIKKYKGRAETNNRVYLVTKGELELTKERLAQAERKLWQAGIPLAPAPSKERPKATGPAAADRPRDEAAPAGEPIASAEGTPTPAEGTPPAVAPIRHE